MSECNSEEADENKNSKLENKLGENSNTETEFINETGSNQIMELNTLVTETESSNQNEVTDKKENSHHICNVLNSQSCVQCGKYEDEIIELMKKNNILNEQQLSLNKLYENLQIMYDNALKEKEAAIKEKESVVIRYATSEKNVLDQKSAKEIVEKKLKDALRENEILQHKVNQMCSEKARICQMLDNKSHELKQNQQELEHTKSDLGALETKMKWLQNNLKTELEIRKEHETKIESLNNKVQESSAEMEQAKKDAQESIKTFQTSQDNRAYVLDQQLKEQQATLIMLKHEKSDRDHQVKTLQVELERVQTKQKEMLHENNELSLKVQQLERERLEIEQKLSELRGYADQQRQDAADLFSKTAQLEQIKLQLKNEQDQLAACNEQISLLKQRNTELESDMESCRIKEAELLLFTQQLTDKNVRLQSEFTAMETKVYIYFNTILLLIYQFWLIVGNQKTMSTEDEFTADDNVPLSLLAELWKVTLGIEECNVEAFLSFDENLVTEDTNDMPSVTNQSSDIVELDGSDEDVEEVQQLSCEQSLLKRTNKEQETKSNLLNIQLTEDRKKYSTEIEKLGELLAEKSKLCEKLIQEVADQKGENSVIRRKLELSLREVNKELSQYRKKLDQYECINNNTSTSSSSSSLNTVERNGESSPTSNIDQVKVVQPERVLDKQVLIEHIVKLQRISARKSEKIDFLEEHVNSLVSELQKKSRLLHNYILREQAGTLSSNTMDNNKAILAKYPGIMSSVYSSRVSDSNLTLELSLDINRKLQAVLEDALLENITLKENVDTLGVEIDRLNKQLKS
ncbi:ctcl tumor antigen hd-cl-01 [Holotrichia oblita]|uniref:Ctcl tumor antigen hd-cl-01 n=1 Tax=Holotrichia oblita TaxID=644536 RepID=A0ACB9SRI6_HOLOL|nr:ctcl tumor antigen hd-cl-01 [Holotrichia oblita]